MAFPVLFRRPRASDVLLGGLSACLEIPLDPLDYLARGGRQRLRQEAPYSDALGVRFRLVTERPDRERLRAVADHHERWTAADGIRNTTPQNEDMLALAPWLDAEDSSGGAVLLAVVTIAPPAAVLRSYRTLARSSAASATRFAAAPVLVEHLRALDVHHLVEPGRPYCLHNGARMFQREVGLRLVRTRLVGRSDAPEQFSVPGGRRASMARRSTSSVEGPQEDR